MDSIELSLCGLAMLGVIVDRCDTGATASELMEAVPYHARIDALPGQISEWPHNVAEWFDELQVLLDRKLVVRQAARDRYAYHATSLGVCRLKASLHPAGASMRSIA